MRKKICKFPGCNNLIDTTERYCSIHHKQETKKPFENAKRYNTKLYNTAKWHKLRNKILKEQPNCFMCGISGKETKLEVHHTIPPKGDIDLFYDESKLIALCSKCHKIVTNYEIRKKGM
jgi:5-methylcytosine-specific restriction protein A